MTEHFSYILLNAFRLLAPEMVLGIAACVLFVGATVSLRREYWAMFSLAALVVAAGFLQPAYRWSLAVSGDAIYSSPLMIDGLAMLVKMLALVGGAVLVLLSWDQVPDRQAPEYYGCLLVAIAGLSITGSANELMTLFLALELISIPSYILIYLPRADDSAREAAMKYFLLSVFSSALLLFGFSYMYGLAGTTNIPALVDALGRDDLGRLPNVLLVGLILVFAGLGFRITAVPFHYYAPDVYQGAPTVVAAFLAFVPKVAGFTALLRVLGLTVAQASPLGRGERIAILVWILAVATMTLGNILALLQTKIKRLLAYSSVAHAGYMLIGVAVAYLVDPLEPSAPAAGGVSALLFYLVAYVAMTVGAFGVLCFLGTPDRPVATLDDISGLSRYRPGIALLMGLFLFSLIGIPLTAGFSGKLLLFWGAMAQRGDYGRLYHILALIAVLNSAVGAFYYLRILSRMYLYPSIGRPTPASLRPALVALWVCAAVTLIFGIVPSSLQSRLVGPSTPDTLRAPQAARLQQSDRP